jgi:chorismate lyase/3-hydroxybenzoate synthase
MEATEAKKRQWGVRRKVVARTLPSPAPLPFDLAAPQWAANLLAGGRRSILPREWPLSLAVTDSERFTLVTARVARATEMDDAAFERCAAGVYAALAEVIAARPGRHPVRFWNHIPDIRRSGGESLDRYMVFNAGRFAACAQWFGSPDAFDRLLPTASAVGHLGADLVVHVLASDQPGRSVENPRQVPSYRYSRRFGPRPPCFARATAVNWDGGAAATILVGGTASIRGEESMHVGNLAAQGAETFENLDALVRAAGGQGLAAFEALRVYFVHDADRTAIERMVAAAFPHLRGIEYVRADLCRPDLLVEIEGVARGEGATDAAD